MHKSHPEEHFKKWEHQKKTITIMIDRFIDRGLELWNHKEITTTLTVCGTVRTAVGRDILSKILGKTSVKKLVKRVAVLKTE